MTTGAVIYKVYKDLYIGIPFNFYKVNATELNPLMREDDFVLKDGTDIFHTGMGLGIKYDSRDIPENAWKGAYVGILYTIYGSYLGGQINYNVLNIDYRQYATLEREGSTIAWRLNARFSSKSTPWTDMSKIGGSARLRGYFESRYRDNEAMYTVIEYRRMFAKKNGELSKHGAVIWLGGGYVKSNNLNIDGAHLLPNYGIGYRLELQTRMNLRLDFGFGKDAFGVYFGFQEAF
jgi:outer membrane protein assembly factor BamA